MNIIIEGKPKEGKSTMAFLISNFLKVNSVQSTIEDGTEYGLDDQKGMEILMVNHQQNLINKLQDKMIIIKTKQAPRSAK